MPLAFFGGVPGGGEIVLVLLVLLLLFGAKNLPKIARTLGRTMEEFRRASQEVTREIMRADEPVPPTAPPEAEGESVERRALAASSESSTSPDEDVDAEAERKDPGQTDA